MGGALLQLFNFFKQFIILFAILFLILCVYLYLNQNQLIYPTNVNGLQFPSQNPFPFANPSQQGLKYKELFITTKDNIKLYGWLVYLEEVKKRTIIYFQENAGNIGFRLPFIKYIVTKLNANCIIVGYRGYGLSQGSPSEKGLKLDGEAVTRYVFESNDSNIQELVDKTKVYVYGRSLGGAVAAHVAANLNLNLRGVILENTFSSMGEMVDNFYPFLKYLRDFMLTNKWETKKIIGKIKYNLMFFKSELDEMVNPAQMELLISLAKNAKTKDEYLIKRGTHLEGYLVDMDGYMKAFLKFMDNCESQSLEDVFKGETENNSPNSKESKKDK